MGLVGRRCEGFLDLLLRRPAQSLNGQNPVHIIPQAPGSGDPAGRGMGLAQVSPLFQVQHEVADGGRRQVQARGLGHGPGPHRFPGNNVLGHHGFKDPGIPLSQDFHDAILFHIQPNKLIRTWGFVKRYEGFLPWGKCLTGAPRHRPGCSPLPGSNPGAGAGLRPAYPWQRWRTLWPSTI